ncbi:hypothetical protein M433DRAFT_8339 [Acidomyces richmondensis BFW]|nr:hypothetical protein M433DRAFT_8339 [Acidomyces richmondensis BFW]
MEKLQQTYELSNYTVRQATKISDGADWIRSRLTHDAPVDGKPLVLCLSTKCKSASKLISIVEIAKRELVSKGIKCFQYTALSSELIDIPRDQPKQSKGGNADEEAGRSDDESDDAFQTMGAQHSETKKRNMPVISVYLSRESLRDLKGLYGEQTA